MTDHLAVDPAGLPSFTERFDPSEHANLQLAIDALLVDAPGWRLVGLPAELHHFGAFSLASILAGRFHGPAEPCALEFVSVAIDVGQAVQVRLPDDECRARLLDLYLRGTRFRGDDLTQIIEATSGVTASFIKELVRRAVLVAARERADDSALTAPDVTSAHIETALDDLLHHSAPVLRSSLGANPDLANQLDPFEPSRAPELGVGGWFAFGSSDGPDDAS